MEFTDKLLVIEDVKTYSPEQIAQVKKWCQTELYFLANNVLRNRRDKRAKPLIPRVHKTICDTLIPCDPDKDYPEWDTVKEVVILAFRGSMKSMLEAAFIVQIILCCPNIRILILSGKLDLAQTVLTLARGYFEKNEVLQYLFPEFCCGIKINADKFTTPARSGVDYRDPTIALATFDSTKAGIRADIVLMDDCTNEINCATPEYIEKTVEQYDDLDPLIEPGGYKVFTGTRWGVDDLPEIIRQRGEEMEKETGINTVRYLNQPVWKVKSAPDAKTQLDRDDRERRGKLDPEEVELLWPEKLNAKFLWPMYRANRRKFACQYLLNPESVSNAVFKREQLVRQTRPITEQPPPHKSDIFINWDMAGLSGKGDWSVGMVGVWGHDGRLFLIDCVMEKFGSSAHAVNAIVGLFIKWAPVAKYRIEDACGAKFLSGEITRTAQEAKIQHPFFIDWGVPEKEKDAKTIRIRELASALDKDMIRFYSGMPNLQEIYNQFEKFTGKGKYKDDGPDCIAQMYTAYRDQIRAVGIKYLTPSGNPVEFEPEFDRYHIKKDEEVDLHNEELANADADWLSSFTMESPTQG